MQIDSQYIDDHHVVPRYLADQLSDEELEAFEAYCLAHPEILQDLEAVARLKLGLQALDRTGELKSLLHTRKRVWRLAIAAAVAAVVIAASVILVRPVTKRPLIAALAATLTDDAGKPLPVITKRYVMRMRSGAYDAQLQIPAARQAIELRILSDQSSGAHRYSLQVSRIDEMQPPRPIGDLDDLTVGPDGYVVVYLDSAQLSAGIYELRLRQADAPNDVSVFLLHAIAD